MLRVPAQEQAAHGQRGDDERQQQVDQEVERYEIILYPGQQGKQGGKGGIPDLGGEVESFRSGNASGVTDKMIRALMIPGIWAAAPANKDSRAGLLVILPAACQPSSTWTAMNSSGKEIARRGLDSARGVKAMNTTWVMYRLIINCTKGLSCFKRSPGQRTVLCHGCHNVTTRTVPNVTSPMSHKTSILHFDFLGRGGI